MADDSPNPLDYQSATSLPLPAVRTPPRVVRVPRVVHVVHRVLLNSVTLFSVLYGVVLMSVGWMLKQGIVIAPPTRRRRRK